MMDIKAMNIIQDSDINKLNEDVFTIVEDMQLDGWTVDVQYQMIVKSDGYTSYTIHSAMIIGRGR